MKQDLPPNAMVGSPNLAKVDERVDGSKEGTV
jgi:hypothetical protein